MRIPADKLDAIRAANDIVDVISQHVRLKKRGKNFIGLCPFHQEKTPSFTVSADKQVYHCFGCGKGGNVFTFVMELEKVSFTEAVRTLAEKAGIPLTFTQADERRETEIENLYNACRFAGLFFYNNLTKTDEGRSALEYFHQRGFTDETIRTFGLGYSLNSWDALLTRAKGEGIAVEWLLKAGLVRSREEGGEYDYFRGRAMFPIFSPTGRVIGFGARKIREDDPIQGKYINSPETPIYNKSRVLFGLFHAKDAIREHEDALMVEGYADLISLYQAGIQNVVASSGTALTDEQVELIGRYTRRMTLVYDADSAGSQATIRGLDLVLAHGFDVRIAELPEGEDPDSFVRKHGGKEFLKLVDQAVSFIDFKAKQFLRAGAFETPEGKTQAIRSIVQSIAKIPDELKRNLFVKEVATKYDIYESIVHRELEKWLSEKRNRREETATAETRSIPVFGTVRADRVSDAMSPVPAAERDILKLLLENRTELVSFIFSRVTLADLTHEGARRLAELILTHFDERGGAEISDVLESLEDASLKSLVTDVAVSRYELSKGWHELEVEVEEADPFEIARGAIAALRKTKLQKEIEANQKLLKEASLAGENALPFVHRHQELIRKLKEVESPDYLKTL
jgi:DNA primase